VRLLDQGSFGSAQNDVQQGARLVHVEDAQGHLVVAAQADGGKVHHLQLAVQYAIIGQAFELLGVGILERIGRVYTIDLGGLEHHVRIDFNGPQAGGRVGGAKGAAGTGGKDHHFAALEVAHGLATVVVVGDADHGDGRHDQGGDVGAFQGITHGQGVHHGGQHAHVVTGDAIHAGGGQRRATEQVATADHQADLDTDPHQLTDFQRHTIEHLGVDTEFLGPHQGFAAEFE